MSLKEERGTFGTLSFSAVIKGVLVALVVTILGSALMGLVYQVTGVSERTLPAVSVVLFYLSLIIGSFIAARDAGARGLLHGVAVAVLFLLLAWLIAGLFFSFSAVPGNLLLRLGLSGIAGALGGVLGVGLSR